MAGTQWQLRRLSGKDRPGDGWVAGRIGIIEFKDGVGWTALSSMYCTG